MSCCCHLDSLNTFWTGSPEFSFCTGPYKLWSWSWLRLQSSEDLTRLDIPDASLTRLLADAGCRLGAPLRLSPEIPTHDFSAWPEFLSDSISRVRCPTDRSQGFHITNRIQNKVDTVQLNKNWIGTQKLQSAVDIQREMVPKIGLNWKLEFSHRTNIPGMKEERIERRDSRVYKTWEYNGLCKKVFTYPLWNQKCEKMNT